MQALARRCSPCPGHARRRVFHVPMRTSVAIHARLGRGKRDVSAPVIEARWTFDCKYGRKMDAIALLQEWVQEVGTCAEPELNDMNTRIRAGNIGAPESRLELEVTLESLDELERFWASIDPEKHMAWGEKVKEVMIDGSPRWEVYRGVDPFGGGRTLRPVAVPRERKSGVRTSQPSDILEMASMDDVDRYASKSFGSSFTDAKDLLGGEADEESGGSGEGEDVGMRRKKRKPVLDWKGDPMVINPGDKLPFTFD